MFRNVCLVKITRFTSSKKRSVPVSSGDKKDAFNDNGAGEHTMAIARGDFPVSRDRIQTFIQIITDDAFRIVNKVIPPGLEPGTVCLEGRCSIQLSYGT